MTQRPRGHGPIFSPEDIANLRSLNLNRPEVRGMLAGFLHSAILDRHHLAIPRTELMELLDGFVETIEELLDQAIRLYELGLRAPGPKEGPSS